MTDLPRSDEFYEGISGPLYLVHPNGKVYAILSSANQALPLTKDDDLMRHFHIENAKGERVEVKDQPGAPWHAYAVLEALDRVEES